MDSGCRQTLVNRTKGPFVPEVLRMKCIQRDIKEYRTKHTTIGINTQMFTCRVGVVPHLDCGFLMGRDCPILTQLL